jgi:glycosyltransferase involved in cell wall biosynthesis
MNVFFIPSWYPTHDFPTVGIFQKEQAELLAKVKPEWNIGISLWGSHEPSLWLKANKPFESLFRVTSKFPLKPYDNQLSANCVEIFHPAFTWSRKIQRGNIKGIIEVNRRNLERFEKHFGKVDIIHAHVAYPAGMIASQLCAEFQIPFVITEHMSPFPLPSFKSDYRKTLLPPLQEASTIISVSESLQSELTINGIESRVIPNLIDTERFFPKKVDHAIPQILAVGRLEKQKGFDLLIGALAKLKELDWHLSIVGEGSEQKKLMALIRENRLENRIELKGDLSRESVVSEMQQCDFFVLSSRHESFGMVVAETMACGKPVVFTKCGGVTELLDESVGIASKSELGSLSQNLEQMLRGFRQFEPELIRDFVSKRFAPEVIANQIEKVYQEVLSAF